MEKILTFRVGGTLFGIGITDVKEINRNVEYTAVPRAPDRIVGLFNMRGQIVTLYNLAQIMGFEGDIVSGKATCIILKSISGQDENQGFLIDKTGDVLDLSDDLCEDPPANVDDIGYKHVKKVARIDKELLLIIDSANVFLNHSS